MVPSDTRAKKFGITFRMEMVATAGQTPPVLTLAITRFMAWAWNAPRGAAVGDRGVGSALMFPTLTTTVTGLCFIRQLKFAAALWPRQAERSSSPLTTAPTGIPFPYRVWLASLQPW